MVKITTNHVIYTYTNFAKKYLHNFYMTYYRQELS